MTHTASFKTVVAAVRCAVFWCTTQQHSLTLL